MVHNVTGDVDVADGREACESTFALLEVEESTPSATHVHIPKPLRLLSCALCLAAALQATGRRVSLVGEAARRRTAAAASRLWIERTELLRRSLSQQQPRLALEVELGARAEVTLRLEASTASVAALALHYPLVVELGGRAEGTLRTRRTQHCLPLPLPHNTCTALRRIAAA